MNGKMTNVLDLADQSMFLGERATGSTGLLQCVWVYNRAIDIEGLRRFHHHLQRGWLSRRIERSPLPFARARWVTSGAAADIEIARPRPRAEFQAWLNEQTHAEIDSEHGPGLHLAVLPFTDGGAGVSLVTSHALADGLGLCEAVANAARGRDDAIDWPAAGSRRRRRALREDARQTARDTRGVGRAIAAGARLARRGGAAAGSGAPPATKLPKKPAAGADERVFLPTTTVFVDADVWDARARALGGTSNALFSGLAVRLAERLGRVAADGTLTMAMAVNERVPGDTRANAVSNVDITVDPAPATSDLRGIRSAVKQALIRQQETPDDRWKLLALVPFVPRRILRRMVSVAAGGPTTVIASNLGAVDPAATRVDGSDADYFSMMSLFPGVTKEIAYRAGGRLALGAGRVHGKVFVTVIAYQPDGDNSTAALEHELSCALSDFHLTATAGWGRLELVGAA
jgi:diacylglycerol O-acyltransferase